MSHKTSRSIKLIKQKNCINVELSIETYAAFRKLAVLENTTMSALLLDKIYHLLNGRKHEEMMRFFSKKKSRRYQEGKLSISKLQFY